MLFSVNSILESEVIIPVVLSGGSGTRLWPLSRQAYPKQFLNLVDDNSLLGNTIARLDGLEVTALSSSAMMIIVSWWRVCCSLGRLAQASILLEPIGRNTAPAIALAALQALSLSPDAVLLVMPADHVIKESSVLQKQ